MKLNFLTECTTINKKNYKKKKKNRNNFVGKKLSCWRVCFLWVKNLKNMCHPSYKNLTIMSLKNEKEKKKLRNKNSSGSLAINAKNIYFYYSNQ